jgi:hypothetical protein
MAYDAKQLTSLAYGNGHSLWHYKASSATGDSLATITAPGYFTGDSGNGVSPGDRMTITGSDAQADYIISSGGTGSGIHVDLVDGSRRVHEHKKEYYGTLLTQTDLLAGTSHFLFTHAKGYITRFSAVVKKAVTTGGTLTIELATSNLSVIATLLLPVKFTFSSKSVLTMRRTIISLSAISSTKRI